MGFGAVGRIIVDRISRAVGIIGGLLSLPGVSGQLCKVTIQPTKGGIRRRSLWSERERARGEGDKVSKITRLVSEEDRFKEKGRGQKSVKKRKEGRDVRAGQTCDEMSDV